MLCQFEKLLYPKDAHAASAGSYMVAVYRPCEIVRDSSGSILPQPGQQRQHPPPVQGRRVLSACLQSPAL